jgi:hypothetical protein
VSLRLKDFEMNDIETEKGKITIIDDKEIVINNSTSFLELLFSTLEDTIVLNKENFDNSFYDLKSGLAGELLQKISNYRRRLIILGDFDNIESKSLRDFIYESNKNGQIIFSSNIDDAIKLLS